MRLGRSAAALGLLVAFGCGRAPEAPPAAGPPLQGAVILLLDTVRADHLSAYGYRRATTPVLDRLAERGVLFEQVVSYAPWTLPSVAAMLSGRRSDAVYVDQRLRESLIERFREAGFATAAITEGGFVSRSFGFDLGFEDWVEEEGAVQLPKPGGVRDANPNGGIENTFRRAREWLSRIGERPFVLLIHTYEPHTPYVRDHFTAGLPRGRIGEVFGIEMLPALQSGQVRITDDELTYLEALYDGGLFESDRQIGEFLNFLEERGLAERTLLAVTSDHGEELGGHHRSHVGDHGHALYDDQLLVPLILHDPSGSYPVRRVVEPVRLLDLLPTVAELLSVRLPDDLDGASLLPAMRGAGGEGRVAFGGSTKAGPGRAFVRHRNFKFIAVVDPRVEKALLATVPPYQLYDLEADPGEQHNLADERPEVAAAYWRLLERLATAPPTAATLPEEVDRDLVERLRSLGYVQ